MEPDLRLGADIPGLGGRVRLPGGDRQAIRTAVLPGSQAREGVLLADVN